MLQRWIKQLLMFPEGDGGNGGTGGTSAGAGAGGTSGAGAGTNGAAGAAAGDPLFGDSGAGGAGGGQGGSAGAGGAGNSANGAGAGGGAGSGIPENWRDSLPDDVKALPQSQKYKTVADLIKGYAHLEKHLGEKLVPPQRGTPIEQMKEYFTRLGLPPEEKDYKIDLAQEKAVTMNKDFLDQFQRIAYGANLLPEQASKLVNWIADINNAAITEQQQAYQSQVVAGLHALQKEWGEGYNINAARARVAAREFFDENGQNFLKESGLSKNPHVLKALAKMGGMLSEDQIKGAGGELSGGQLTPQEAQSKLNELRKQGSPYWDKGHAQHSEVKQQVRQLYAMAFPGQVMKATAGEE